MCQAEVLILFSVTVSDVPYPVTYRGSNVVIQKQYCAVLFVNTNKTGYIVTVGKCMLNAQFRTLGEASIDSSIVTM